MCTYKRAEAHPPTWGGVRPKIPFLSLYCGVAARNSVLVLVQRPPQICEDGARIILVADPISHLGYDKVGTRDTDLWSWPCNKVGRTDGQLICMCVLSLHMWEGEAKVHPPGKGGEGRTWRKKSSHVCAQSVRSVSDAYTTTVL